MHQAIARALDFLVAQQTPSGEIILTKRIASSPVALVDHAVFAVPHVIYCLREIDDRRAATIIARARAFLLAERWPDGFWRFGTKASGLAIDADVDDTATAAVALGLEQDEGLVSALLRNRDRAGRFMTWFRPVDSPNDNASNDVDVVANVNCLFMLGDRLETEAASRFLIDVIGSGGEAPLMHYYADPRSLDYAVARAATRAKSLTPLLPRLIERIERASAQGQLTSATSMAQALAVLTWVVPQHPLIARAVTWLLAQQRDDGSFASSAIWMAPQRPAPPALWWSSDGLTTAFCIEALAGRGILEESHGQG